jgi:hypothetical protein
MQLTEKTSMSFGVTLTACLIGKPKRRDDERNAWHGHERYVGDSDCKHREKITLTVMHLSIRPRRAGHVVPGFGLDPRPPAAVQVGSERIHYKLPMGGKMSTCAGGNSSAAWTSADADADVDADAGRVHIPCAWHAC